MVTIAVAYLRVSTDEQDVASQKTVIEEFGRTRGFTILWFSDDATSGAVKALERQGFRKMMDFLESNNNVRDLIVFDLSRLGRDYDDLKEVLFTLAKMNVRLWVATMPAWNELMGSFRYGESPLMDLFYKLLIDIFTSVMSFASAQERVLTIMRTKAGIARARMMGKKVGRPPYPLPIDEILMLMKKGLSIKMIHRILVSEGKICRQSEINKQVKCISYEHFRQKIKKILKNQKKEIKVEDTK